MAKFSVGDCVVVDYADSYGEVADTPRNGDVLRVIGFDRGMLVVTRCDASVPEWAMAPSDLKLYVDTRIVGPGPCTKSCDVNAASAKIADRDGVAEALRRDLEMSRRECAMMGELWLRVERLSMSRGRAHNETVADFIERTCDQTSALYLAAKMALRYCECRNPKESPQPSAEAVRKALREAMRMPNP